ncbi:unnamed protein product [Prunus armeniaca]
MADSLSKSAGNQSQARDIQRTDEYHPACCQKHPLDQHIFSPLFLHQIQPRKRKENKKKQQTKSGSSHCTAAGKEDVEPPKSPEFMKIDRSNLCQEREVREGEEKGRKA